MKIIATVQRFVIASLIALALGLAAAPQARAADVPGELMSQETLVQPLNGGGGKDGTETHGRLDTSFSSDKDGHETHG